MPLAPGIRLADRLAALRARFEGAGVSALLVTNPANVFYLSNFRGSAGMLLAGTNHVTLIVDARYASAAQGLLDSYAGCPGMGLVEVTSSYEESVAALLRAGSGRVGVEADHITVARHDWLAAAVAAAGIDLRPLTGAVEAARVVKDREELATLRDAGERLSQVMAAALAGLRPGRAEREVAADIDHAIRVAGFEGPAFETIVAAGANTALPHARPGPRVLEAGDLVLLDFGGTLDGYCVDMTRVASLGPPGANAAAWHDAVRAAHAAALAAVRPGAAAVDIDAAARQALDDRGLGGAFTHATGHGLGIEVHEAPRIGQRRTPPAPDRSDHDVRLQIGMVFTIEPGVYLPPTGGIRLEDDVVVTRAGCELLTAVPLDLYVV